MYSCPSKIPWVSNPLRIKISVISRQGTTQGSYAWGHIPHFQTFGSPSGFLHLWTHLGFPDTGQWRVSVHAQQHARPGDTWIPPSLARQWQTREHIWGNLDSWSCEEQTSSQQPAEEVGGIRGEDRQGSLGSFPHTFYLRANWHLHFLGTGMQNLYCFWTVLLRKRNTRHGATPSPRGAARNNTNLTSHTSWRRGLIWLQELLEKEPSLPSSSHGPLHLPPDPVPFLAWWYPQCSADSKLLLANCSADPPCHIVLGGAPLCFFHPGHRATGLALWWPDQRVVG